MSTPTVNNEETGQSRSPDHARHTRVRDLGGLAIAASLFGFAALIAWDASGYPVRRSYAQFGPEIFPYIVAGGLFVFGVATVVMALRNSFPEREPMAWPPVLWIIGAVGAQVGIIYGGLGFIVATGALFGMTARGLGRKPLWFTVLVGIGVATFLYVMFRQGLGLSLPSGPVERVIDSLFRR